MRGPDGYGGPVAHWWSQCLLFTGTGLDWRYEGIIDGYITLWRRTGQPVWLKKACRAGDDIVQGQLPSGNFRNSAFELNPCTGGTPHEAACDAGLLLLAQELKETAEGRRQTTDGDHSSVVSEFPDWLRYADCAEQNLRSYYLDMLWDSEARSFRDHLATASFVPNKAATVCEALFLLAEVRSDGSWVDQYALPNLDRIVAHQVSDGGALDGAIAQNSLGDTMIDKYFPKYIARCVPALLEGYRWTANERYADSALRAMRFIVRSTFEDGSLPTVIYPDKRVNRYPSWIAPLADVLRAGEMVRSLSFDADMSAIQQRLMAGQDAGGGVRTAMGFSSQVSGRVPDMPDVRDVLHVAGWCDKVFRYWAPMVQGELPAITDTPVLEVDCVFHGKAVRYRETASAVEVTQHGKTRYRWQKGQSWPEVASPEFWLQ